MHHSGWSASNSHRGAAMLDSLKGNCLMSQSKATLLIWTKKTMLKDAGKVLQVREVINGSVSVFQ
jgi:hypothetical protein